MEITTFERIQSKSLEIVDNDGIARVQITADQNGGRIDVVSTHETGCGISVSFDTGQPCIAILDKDGTLGMTLTVNDEGGYVGIGGKDRKAKLLLFVEDGRGRIEVGEDLLKLS